MQAALLPVLRTGGQSQRQQDGRAGGAGEHVGVFKNGLETLLLQQGVQLHGRAELGGEGHHQLVEKLGGHGVDADQGHQRSRRFQHRGGAASRAARRSGSSAVSSRARHAAPATFRNSYRANFPEGAYSVEMPSMQI